MSTDTENDSPEPTLDVDTDAFDPDPNDYSPTQSFQKDRRTKLEGIFNGKVVSSCFDGDIEPAYGEDNVLLVGRLHECVFGLVLDTESCVVVTGHVLQCNPVQARMSGVWSEDAIQRMESVSGTHQDGMWNGYDDPHVDNSVPWTPDANYR